MFLQLKPRFTLSFYRFSLWRTKPGELNDQPGWCFYDTHGYLYMERTLLKLFSYMLLNWKSDTDIVGY